MENPEYRERIVYRYQVIYRLFKDHIWVVAIIHGNQNFQPHIPKITDTTEA